MNATRYIAESFLTGIPADRERSVAKWGAANVKTFGIQGIHFDPSKTPWILEPMDRLGERSTVRKVTTIGCIQSGKSVINEVGAAYCLATEDSGDVQMNFQDDEFADDRWDVRLERIFKNCEPVRRRWPEKRAHDRKGVVVFAHCSLLVQGVFTRKNVAGNSVRFQFNDEIHLWEPGRLAQAHGRTTACWNALISNVSNAGDRNDQLDIEFHAGTVQRWSWKCPGCGARHVPRVLWDKDKPELGGLRYDADGCRMDNGDYDYNKLKPTIRLQLPCGYEVRCEERRKLNQPANGARYTDPENAGADGTHRSYTYDAAALDYLPLIALVEEKHKALKSLAYGDPMPLRAYVTERECRFWDAEDRPVLNRIVVSTGTRKNRDGLAGRMARFFALDRQQGNLKAGELPHWWMVIRDVMPNGDSMLVWEGKCLTDDDAIGVIKEHGCMMRHGVADSGDDTSHVYQFCLRHGINAIKGSGEIFFRHKDGGKKIYSTESPLHKMIGAPSIYPYRNAFVEKEWRLMPHIDEPLFWHYSNLGLRDRFAWLKSDKSIVKFGIPEDVSADYKKHAEAWHLEERRVGPAKKLVTEYVQHRRRDDLDKCEQYVVMLMEMAGVIGERAAEK